MTKRILPGLVLAMALLVGGCASTSNSSSVGEYIDDSVITTKVKSKLAASKETSALAISVETYKGVVQLSGFVSSQEEIAAAQAIAAGVQGVTSVQNNLAVKN